MFGGIAFAPVFTLCNKTETSNVFDEEKEREVNRIFCAGECYQYLAERDKMQVQTVVL